MLKQVLNAFSFLQLNPKRDRAYIMIRGQRLQHGGYAQDLEKAVYECQLFGWLRAHESFVELDLEGTRVHLEKFIERVKVVPVWSRIDKVDLSWIAEPAHHKGFRKRS